MREMKESGVKLKYLCTCNDENLAESTPDDYKFDYIDIGSVTQSEGVSTLQRMFFKNAPLRARRIVRNGDVIISTVRTYLKAVARINFSEIPQIASTGFAVLRAKNINQDYLYYAVISDSFINSVEANSVGISYPAINASELMNLKISLPSLDKQAAIASYLDDKCSRIDAIIARHELIIAKLKEYRASLITETVTRGLNPDAELKDSGVEWIGKIPAEWRVSKIGRCYTITLGKMLAPTQKEEGETLENYLCATNIKWEGVNTDIQKQM